MVKAFCVALLLLASPALVSAEVTLKMKDGVVLTWKDYFEEGNNYCTWKSIGKFCVSQDDVKVIKESGGSPQYESSGGTSGGYSGGSSSSNSGRAAESSGRTTTIIQRRGNAVIVDEGMTKEERDAEKQRLDMENELRKYEREKRLEKEREDAQFREEQRKKEEAERRYQEERNARIKRDEERLYRGMGNKRY